MPDFAFGYRRKSESRFGKAGTFKRENDAGCVLSRPADDAARAAEKLEKACFGDIGTL
jgi:hypothetical protein